MKTSPVTPEDLARSVLAVPPLCLDADFSLAEAENRKLVRHIEAGGVSTILWGGNAQLQHWPSSRYGEVLAMAEAIAAPGSWVIPSAGPDYGKLMDEARALKGTRFPCAMLLPMPAHTTPAGVLRGLSDFVQAAGKPAILYVRQAGYVEPEAAAKLVRSGEIAAIKYAVTVQDFRKDTYLRSLVDAVGRERMASGFGELPAVPHLDAYRLQGFTSGSVCIAPRRSMRVLAALKARRIDEAERLVEPIRALEALREKISPIRVIHEAVRLAGIADTGPILPMLSDVEPELHGAIGKAARALREAEAELAGPQAAAAE
jgi:dihydrodipicolinate synthase/N-acetylneuraminate lyase